MATVCHRHTNRPSAGVCNLCSVGLCGSCITIVHPPVCILCFTQLGDAERETILSRIVIAGVLAVIGPAMVFALATLSATIGPHLLPAAFLALMAHHGIAVMPIVSYVLASIPYGYAAGRAWLRPPLGAQTSMPMLVLATMIVSPFIAPLGVITDRRRWTQLRGRAYARVLKADIDAPRSPRRVPIAAKPALPAPTTSADIVRNAEGNP